MTRGRGLPLVSRVCIGVFLLFFSDVIADTIKGPPALEKLRLAETEATTQGETVLNELSTDQTNFTSSSTRDHELVNSSKQGDKDPDGTESSVITDAKPEEEKVPTAASKGIEVQGIRSQEADRLLASDPTNGGARFEESLYGTSGKSSSTKAVFEDFYRLPRTNGLTTVTAKPGFEEASSRVDERRNRTSASVSHQEVGNITGHAEGIGPSVEDTSASSRLEHVDRIRTQNILESKDKLVGSSAESGVEQEKLEEEEREKELTTPKGFSEENREEGRKTTENSEKNSEVADLEKVAERKENGESISLINDTYVNYSHYYKTSTGKDLESDSGNQSGASENGTNQISEDSGVSHGRQDPKEEVEVVRNVTQPPIEKIIAKQFLRDNSTTPTADGKFDNELDGRQTVEVDDARNPDNSTRTNVDAIKLDNKEDRPKLDTVTITSGEEGATPPQSNSSLIPRGRTIAFSGANEFSSQETKTTQVAPAREIDTPPLKKNVSLEKTNDQKPYPYAKSSKASTESTSSGVQSTGATTEETSAYENTIDRADSERKIIVTEPSVVIENSIQQYKSSSERAGNESLNFTTESQAPAVMSTASLAATDEARPTNQTFLEEPYTDLKTIGTKQEDGQGSSTGNDVSRGNERSEVITAKDENFDVTGNGITEVSLKPESPDSANNRASYEPSFQPESSSANTATEVLPITNTERAQTEAKMASNADVQTTAEESLLIRSTLNVSEVSTEYPLTKETENSTLNSTLVPIENTTVIPVTTPANATEAASTVNVSVAPMTTSAVNETNEISTEMSASTLNPDETSFPSTTSVEYEFVGLSEATGLPSQNITERTTEERTEAATGTMTVLTTTVPTVQGLVTADYSEGSSSTLSSEITLDSSAATTEIPSPSGEEKSSTAVPERILTLTPNSTIELKFEASTELPSNETQTESPDTKESEKAVTDSLSTTEESVTAAINTVEDTVVTTTTRETRFIPVTETSTVESSSISNTTTVEDPRTISAAPVLPSSLPPRIFVSSTWDTPTNSGDMPTEEVDIPQTLSPEEITSLVRIVMKATCEEVYPHLETVRTTLVKMLEAGTNKSINPKQIIFHQNPCVEASGPTPTPTDVPLTSILVYVVDEDGKFDSTLTNILPSLYKESRTSFPIAIHSFLLVQETDSGNAIAVVVVSSVAFICLVLLAGLLFIMRKRQTRFNYGERCRPVSLDAYSLDSVSAYNSVRRKGVARSSKRSYGNPTFEDSSAIPSHPLNFAGLSSFCNDVNAINEEFSSIPQVSAKIDELPPGAELKNRYANVIPLPETRVPLQRINNDPLSEYINANYVRGPRNATRCYIACQAPMESTVTDFWRMIWEQQCKVIIMLTDLVENGMEKCTEYIPPSEVTDCHRLYGDFQVTLKKRETKEKYAISTLHLKNLENNTFREVFHIWYLWPVNAVQSDGTGLIAVILEARALQRGDPGSIVVHCSPGTGRTGTLIALDLGIRQYEITRTVNVPRVVYTIRRDRAGAVQTKEQYAFIYKALNLYATKLAGGVLEST